MFVGSLGRHWVKCAQLLSVLLGLLVVPALAQYEASPYRVEIFGGGSCFIPNGRYLPTDQKNAPTMKGWGTSIYTPFSGNAGAVMDVSGNYGSGNGHLSVMFGAEFKFHKGPLHPFGEGMLGWARRNPKSSEGQATAVFGGGGGLDLQVSHRFAIRLIRADYIHSFANPSQDTSGTNVQTFWNSIRLQSGVVMVLGAPPEERSVAVACTATPNQVHVGEPVSAKMAPNGFVHPRKLSYTWQLNDAKLGSSSSNAVIETGSLSPGNYTLKATASDSAKGKHHQSASCTATFAVLELPKSEPSAPVTGESQPAAETPTKSDAQPTTEAAANPVEPGTTPAADSTAPSSEKTPSSAPAQPSSTEAPAQPQVPSAPAEEAPSRKSEIQATTVEASATKETSSAKQSATEATATQEPATTTATTQTSSAAPATVSSAAPVASASNEAPASSHAAPEKAAVADSKPAKPTTANPSATPSSAPSLKGKRTTRSKQPNPSTTTPPQPIASSSATNTPEKVAVTAKPAVVISGEPSTITVRTPSVDSTAPAPTCTTTAGSLRPDSGNFTLDTAGVPAGEVTVTCTEKDGHPLGSAVIQITTQAKPGPHARKLNSVTFNDAKRPARVDNVAKQILRDAAHALQQSEPGSKLILVGNARAAELETNKSLASQRASNAKAFLMDQQNGGGVDASSINLHVGKADTRRVDIYLAVPGATFNPNGKAALTKRGFEGNSAMKMTHKR